MTRTVGVIGVGNMGEPMVRRLASEYETVAYDLDPDRLESVADAGAVAADSPAEVGERCDTVLLSLPSGEAVEATVEGPENVLSTLSGGALIDASTVAPATTERVAAACEEAGVEFLDAPVSGGPRNAEPGTLTVMVGGSEEALAAVRPVLETIGERIYHVGPQGAGIAMKLTNNYMLALNNLAFCEGLSMARAADIPDETFSEVVSEASGNSYAVERNMERFVLRDRFEAEGSIPILRKDAALAEAFGADLGVPLPFGGGASGIYRLAERAGYENLDMAGMVEFYRERAEE